MRRRRVSARGGGWVGGRTEPPSREGSLMFHVGDGGERNERAVSGPALKQDSDRHRVSARVSFGVRTFVGLDDHRHVALLHDVPDLAPYLDDVSDDAVRDAHLVADHGREYGPRRVAARDRRLVVRKARRRGGCPGEGRAGRRGRGRGGRGNGRGRALERADRRSRTPAERVARRRGEHRGAARGGGTAKGRLSFDAFCRLMDEPAD